MLTWLAATIANYRTRGWGWRAYAAILVVAAVLIGAVVMWWNRRQQAARAHEAFVAQVDARAAADKARERDDDAQVEALKERAAEALAKADLAAKAADEAQQRHDQDRDRIDAIRSWADVPDRPR